MIISIVIATGALLVPAIAAHAEDAPPPVTYRETLAPVLDCADATLTFWTVTYKADAVGTDEETGAIVYGDWYETGRVAEVSAATGDSADSDCPNWVTDEDGNWYNSDTHPKPQTPSPVEHPQHPEHPDHPAKADDGILWKLGING